MAITIISNVLYVTEYDAPATTDVVDLGAESADRIVLAFVHMYDGNDILGGTFNGVAATLLETSDNGAGGYRSATLMAVVPTGTGNQNCTINFSSWGSGAGVIQYVVLTGAETTPLAYATTRETAGPTPAAPVTLATAAGGLILAAAGSNSSSADTFAGSSETLTLTRYNDTLTSQVRTIFGVAENVATNPFTVDTGASAVLSVVSFQPTLPFTPASLGAKCLGWMNIDDAGSLDIVSGNVENWRDQVGTRTFTEATNRPAYSATGGPGGTPCIIVDGTESLTLSSVPYPTGTSAARVYAVCSQDDVATDTTQRRLFQYGDNTGASSRGIGRRVNSGVNRYRTGSGTSEVVVNPVDFSGWHWTMGRWDGSGNTGAGVNGVEATPAAVAVNSGTTRTRIGANAGSSPGEFWLGKVSHIVVTTDDLTTAEEIALEGWLASKVANGPIFIGGGSYASADPPVIPPHQAGDLIIVHAWNGNTTSIGLPAGWTNIDSTVGGTQRNRLAYKIATSSAEDLSAWDSTYTKSVEVWRNAAVGAYGFVAVNVGSSIITYPGVTLQDSSGDSEIALFSGNRHGASSVNVAPAGATYAATRSLGGGSTAGAAGCHRTSGGVTSWSSVNVASANDGNSVGYSVEIKYVDPNGGGDIIGTLSQTLDGLTLSSEARLAIAASMSQTLGALTLSSESRLAIEASVNVTLANLTLSSIAGNAPNTAELAVTLADLTLASAARLAIAGESDITLEALTVSAASRLAIQATADVTLGALILESVGDARTYGELTATLDDLVVAAEAKLAIAGALSQTLAGVSLSSRAIYGGRGDLAATLANLTVAATAQLSIRGQTAKTLAALTLTAEALLVTPPGLIDLGELRQPFRLYSDYDRENMIRDLQQQVRDLNDIISRIRLELSNLHNRIDTLP